MPPPTRPAAPAPPDRYRRGVALRLAGMFAFALMLTITKIAAARGAGTIEIIACRNIFGLLPVTAWVLAGPGLRSVRTARATAHGLRSALGLSAMFLAFQAIVMLPLAQAVTISFTAPLFATLLSAAMLGEHVGPHRWAAIATGMAGVLVVTQPGHDPAAFGGIAVAVAAALTTGVVTITLRQIGATEPAATTVFWFTLACAMVTAPMLVFALRPHDLPTWGLLALIGITGGSQQMLSTAALRHASVSTIAPLDYTQLLWAMLFAWLLLGTPPVPSTLAGGALIVAGGLYTLYRERRLRVVIAAATEPII